MNPERLFKSWFKKTMFHDPDELVLCWNIKQQYNSLIYSFISKCSSDLQNHKKNNWEIKIMRMLQLLTCLLTAS